MIGLSNVSKCYRSRLGDYFALESMSIDLPNNSLVMLIGESGSGKTTFLNIIGGLDLPSSGTVSYRGEAINKNNVDDYRSSHVGFVFQEYNLLNEVSVRENLRIAFDLQNEDVSDKKIAKVLSMVGLPDEKDTLESFLSRRPVELSGGQRQRVAIARALIKNPDVLLLDEPTGALDEKNALSLLSLLKDLSKTRLVVVSTHNLKATAAYADRVIKLSSGKIVSDETKNIHEETKVNLSNTAKKGSLSPFSTVRSALRGLKGKTIKLISSVLLAFITTMCLGVVSSVQTADVDRVILRTQYEEKESSFYMINARCKSDEPYKEDLYPKFSEEQKRILENETRYPSIPIVDPGIFIESIASNDYRGDFFTPFYTFFQAGIGRSNAMVLNYESGLSDALLSRDPRLKKETVCELPKTQDEIALTDFQAEYIMLSSFYGEKITCVDELIGKRIEEKYTITGIFSTETSLEKWKQYGPSRRPTRESNMAEGFFEAQLLIMSDEVLKDKAALSDFDRRMMIRLEGSVENDLRLISKLSKGNEYVDVSNMYIENANGVVQIRYLMGPLLFALDVVFIVMGAILSLNFFYTNIKQMEKELGVLKAMGARKKDIWKIVLIQGLIIVTVESLLSFVGTMFVNSCINGSVGLSLLSINWIVAACIIGSLLGGMLIVSLPASNKAIRQRPINVIDNK